MKKIFVPASTVMQHQDFRSCIFLDARAGVADPTFGAAEFKKLRIKGSIFADMDTTLSGPVTPTSGRHPLPEPSTFIAWCAANGIGTSGAPVVCYDCLGGAIAAARAWWMLDSLGVTAFIVDGGFEALLAANAPTESGDVSAEPVKGEWKFKQDFAGHIDLGDLSKYVVVEARAAPRVSSTIRPMSPLDDVPGGIPGALVYQFQENLTPDMKQLKPWSSIKEQITPVLSNAAKTNKPLAFSCGSGVTACHNIAVTRQLGLGDPVLYVGSWSQYSKVNKDELIAKALQKHGVCMKIHTHNPEGRQLNLGEDSVVVNGKLRVPPFFESPPIDKDLVRALKQLRHGEDATIMFKDGRVSRVATVISSKL